MEATTRALAARVREDLAASGVDAARDPKSVRLLIHRAIDRFAPDLLPAAREQVEADLMDDICGLGPLQALMDDPSVEEIWINAASRVFVARSGVAELTSLILTDEDVRALVERMLHHSGRRLDLSSPFVDAMLAGGERLHVVIPPVTGSSWSVNIRKHIQRARTLDDLVAVDMLAPPMRDFLAAAVSVGLSVLVSGGTQAGKTTLLATLTGIIPPKSGSALINGVPAWGADRDQLTSRITMTAEDAHVFATTIYENLRVARASLTRDEASELLSRAGLAQWVQSLPEGLDTVIGSGGTTVSGGERRRLLMARALAAPAPIMALDEASEHLDAVTADRLMETLLTRSPDRATLVVTHRLSALDQADHVIVLAAPEPGQCATIAARGTHDEVLQALPTYRWALDQEEQ